MSICPCYNHLLIDKEVPTGRDWRQATYLRRYRDGTSPQSRTYIEEISTGDLYKSFDSPRFIALKSFQIIFGSPFYMVGVMGASLIKVVTTTIYIAVKTLLEFGKIWSNKGAIEALASVFFALAWEIPTNIANNLWRVVKAPLYAFALSLVSAYAVISPYEGRKWIAKVESSWHEGADYRDDYRYRTDHTLSMKNLPIILNGILEGKIYFLALCMQPVGNVKEKVGELDRFVPVKD